MVTKKEEPRKPGGALVKAVESAAIPITPETVRQYINKLATPSEITLFLNQCAMFGLNPFKREIYLIKYSEKDPATFVVGYEVYLKRAERTGKWAGMETGTDGEVPTMKAWVKVKRQDWKEPLYHEVFYDEYVQTKAEWANGQPTGKKVPTRFWAEKPRTMLKKVAIAQALRIAFPDEMAGMPYVSEEMPIDHAKLPTAEVRVEAEVIKPAEAHKPNNVKDQFTEPEAFSEDGTAKEPDAVLASDGQKAALMAGIEAIKALGKSEETIWTGIVNEVRKVHDIAFTDTADMTAEVAKTIIDYLARWLEHVKSPAKPKAAAAARG